MTNNNRVGSNVDLFCKLYYNFDQNGPGQGWFDPALLSLLFSSLLSPSPLFSSLLSPSPLFSLLLLSSLSFSSLLLSPLFSSLLLLLFP